MRKNVKNKTREKIHVERKKIMKNKNKRIVESTDQPPPQKKRRKNRMERQKRKKKIKMKEK